MLWLIILLLVVGGIYFCVKISSASAEKARAATLKKYPYAYFNFPEVDPDGNALLGTYIFELTGSHYKKYGGNPQETISNVVFGEPVFFEHKRVSGYPNAYYVFNAAKEPLGWLPEDDDNRDMVVERLKKNLTVYACAKGTGYYEAYPPSDTYDKNAEPVEYRSVSVEVALYELPKN